VLHTLWTDTNKVQNVVWFYGYQFYGYQFYGYQFVPTAIHPEDVVIGSGKF
jgi:hypothetical protein